MKLLLLALLLLAVCQPTFAQQDVRATGTELSLHFGVYHGGSGRSIARKFEEGGFGEEGTSSAVFFGPDDNPQRSEASVQLGVLFPVKQKIRAKGLFLFRDTDLEGNAIFFEPLKFNMYTLTAGALGYLPLFRHFRIGAGPAFHFTSCAIKYGDAVQTREKLGKLGFIFESGFTTPANKRFFVDLQAQYVYGGRTDFDIHTFTVNVTDQSQETRTVDLSNTQLSSFILSLGIGYRLYRPD